MRRNLSIFILCLVVAAVVAWGQGSVGTLNGTVLDSTGAVIPGATVVVTNIGTDVENRTTTTSAGAYTFPYMSAGTYNIRVSSPGFRTATQENVILRVGQVMTVNIQLEVGAVTEEVTVSAAPPLLESGTAEIGRYISSDEYLNWPIMVGDGQRQIQDFIFRSLPGTTGGTFQGSINGGQQYSHEILIEGIPLGRSDLSGGNNNEMSPSAEAIGEFKLQAGAMSAQYNGGSTAVANFGIKSGTNELHGSVFYYGQNEAFNAMKYSDSSRGVEKKSKDRQHNYGYSLGGPIYIPKVYDGRNKTFFFTNLERNQRNVFTIAGLNTTLPTADFRQGDFSRLFDPSFTGNPDSGTTIGTDALGRPVVFGQIYDPHSTRLGPDGNPIRDPIPGNIIPGNLWSSVADNIINSVGIEPADLDEMINNKASIGTCCPFQDLDIIGVKIDHQISDSHRISGYYNHEYRNRNNSPGGRYLPVPGRPTGVFQNQYTPSRMVRLSLNSTIAPTVLNRIAGGYNRFRNSNASVFLDDGWADKVGVKNTSETHFPSMRFGGNEWQGGTTYQIGSSSAGDGVNGSWIAQDDLTIIKGAHTFRVGYEYRKYFYNERDRNGSGVFQFRPVETALSGYSDETGHAFASFIMGGVHSASRGISVLYSGFRQSSHGFYVMDDWKVTPKLTLNLGLRWEVIRPFGEVTDRMSMVDLTKPNSAADGLPGAFTFQGPFQDTNWKQLSPRLGMAYRVNDKMVVRGGYGITNMPPIRGGWGFSSFTTGYSGSIPIIAGTSPTGFEDDPAHWLDDPYPAFQGTLPDTDPDQQLLTGVSTTAPTSTRLPYTQNWNFTVQYQLPAETVLEVAYIGNKGTRLASGRYGALDVLPSTFLTLGDSLRQQVVNHPQHRPYADFPDGQSLAQALKPYPQYTGVQEQFAYFGNSSYHSLQITATRHFTNGLGLLAAYTWSKAITNADNGRQGGSTGIQDYFNRDLDKSLAAYHIPQQLRLSWIYELPFGAGKRFDANSGLNWLIGGWTLSAIHQYQAGSPIRVGQSGLSTPTGFGSILPDATGGSQKLGGAPNDNLDFTVGTPYLDANGFANTPRTDNGVPLRVGTAPRFLPNVRGPHSSSERFRITKKFVFMERLSFEFGAAIVNPFNRHGRRVMSTNINSSNFGKVLISGGGQRTIQLEGRLEW